MPRKPQVRTFSHRLNWDEHELRILISHPRIEPYDNHEGFRLSEVEAKRNLQLLNQMLQLASGQVKVDVDGTLRDYDARLILLPEYALPAGKIEECLQIMNSLPPDSICIAGFDAMAAGVWDEWRKGALNGEELAEAAQGQPDFQWVNAAGIWIREGHNAPVYYLQPKLEGAKEERSSASMLRGSDVLRFEIETAGRTWSLALLICYDMIATDLSGRYLVRRIAEDLPLTDLLVVVQHNDRPDRFHNPARDLLLGGGIAGARVGTVVFVNTAQGQPDDFGHSGLAFLYSDWCSLKEDIPLDEVPRGYRRRSPVNDVTYAGFRCHRPAVHALTYRSVLSSKAKEYIDGCCVFYLDEDGLLPRTDRGFCGPRSVSALDYQVELALDAAEPHRFYKPGELSPDEKTKRQRLAEAHRRLRRLFSGELPYQRIKEIVAALLQVPRPDDLKNPDEWQPEKERAALCRLMAALGLLLVGRADLDLGLQAADPDPRQVFPWPLTGQTRDGTFSIIGGHEDDDYDTILWELFESVEWAYSLKRPHLFLLLSTISMCPEPRRLNLAELKRRDLAGVDRMVSLREPAGFEPQPGETLEGDGDRDPPVYWYTYQALRNAVRDAPNVDEMVQRLEGVFTCLVA